MNTQEWSDYRIKQLLEYYINCNYSVSDIAVLMLTAKEDVVAELKSQGAYQGTEAEEYTDTLATCHLVELIERELELPCAILSRLDECDNIAMRILYQAIKKLNRS